MNLNIQNSNHLSEDDLDEVLIGIGSAAQSAHLTACESCSQRLAAFRTQMAMFNQATESWSEARSNTISRDLAAHRPAHWLSRRALWPATAALLLAVTLGFSELQHRPATLNASDTASSAALTDADIHPAHSVTELESDNAMLAAIDHEMSAPQPSQFGIYQAAKSTANPQRSAVPQARD